ncbi:MAG: hypothetical protein EOO41_01100 [Methanobacteriota archaeon]|nr:MAG: hypothetical protein EOO41_01100 [Euryarchaeota archaeon]
MGGADSGTFVDARWHPLGDKHFIALTTRELQLYELSEATGAELLQQYALPTQNIRGRPVAACFGAARTWELFTVFILYDTGAVYYICPVLPVGCVLPFADWRELVLDARAAMNDKDVLPAVADAFSVTHSWLQEHFPKDAGSMLRCIKPEWSSQFPSVKGASGGRWLFTPCVQGPLAVEEVSPPAAAAASTSSPAAAVMDAPAVDLECAPVSASAYPMLYVLRENGFVHALAAVEPVLPSWSSTAVDALHAPATLVQPGMLLHVHPSHKGANLIESAADIRADMAAVLSAPWLRLPIASLELRSPVLEARAALDQGMGTYAGAPTTSTSATGRAVGGPVASSVRRALAVQVPYFCPVPAYDDKLLIGSRGDVHLIDMPWLKPLQQHIAPSVARADGTDAALGSAFGSALAPSQVCTMLSPGAGVDVVGIVCGSASAGAGRLGAVSGDALGDTVHAWLVPRGCAATVRVSATGRADELPGTVSVLNISSTLLLSSTLSAATEEAAAAAASSSGSGDSAVRERSMLDGLPEAGKELKPLIASVRTAGDAAAAARTAHASVSLNVDAAGASMEQVDAFTARAQAIGAQAIALGKLQAATNAHARALFVAVEKVNGRRATTLQDAEQMAVTTMRQHERVQRLVAFGENLRARSKVLLMALTLIPSQLSAPEREFSECMQASQRELQTVFLPTVAAMKARMDAVIAQREAASASRVVGRSVTVPATTVSDLAAAATAVQRDISSCELDMVDMRMALQRLREAVAEP